MTEYMHCIHNEEVIFNNVLRSSRNQIECVFCRLKAKWPILTKQINLKLKKIPYIVYACFVLHNFCEMSNIQIDRELVQAHTKEIRSDDKILQSHQDNTYVCNTDEEQLVRDIITSYMYIRSSKYIKIILIQYRRKAKKITASYRFVFMLT